MLPWPAFNFIKTLANDGAGILADRRWRLALLRPGWLLYSAAMLGFCLVSDLRTLWVAALFFGFAVPINEGVECAIIGDYARPDERGTLYGRSVHRLAVTGARRGDGPCFAVLAELVAVLILHFRIAARISQPA